MPPSLAHRLGLPFLAAVSALIIAGCGGGGGGTAAVPQAASQTAPGATPPAGTPSSSLGAATVSWLPPQQNSDGSALTNLAGFKIYYGQNSAALDSYVAIGNASISTYVLENLTRGQWFFGVVAVNSTGIESSLSNLATKTIS